MKEAIVILIFSALVAVAQPPEPPKPNPKQEEILKQSTMLQKQLENDYMRLQNLTEFQDYLKVQQQLQVANQQYQAAGKVEPAPKVEKPAVEPAKK